MMSESVSENTHDSLLAAKEKLLQQIQTMTLFDDVFTAVIFKNEGACRHLVRELMQYLKTAKAGDASQGELSQYVNYLKSPEGGRVKMGEFEKYFREEGRKAGVEEGLKKGVEEGLKEGLKKGVEEGRKEGLINSVKALMQNTKISSQEAMRMLSIPPKEQQKLLPLL